MTFNVTKGTEQINSSTIVFSLLGIGEGRVKTRSGEWTLLEKGVWNEWALMGKLVEKLRGEKFGQLTQFVKVLYEIHFCSIHIPIQRGDDSKSWSPLCNHGDFTDSRTGKDLTNQLQDTGIRQRRQNGRAPNSHKQKKNTNKENGTRV